MKILVACEMPDYTLSELRALGNEVSYEPALTTAGIIEHIADAAILIVGRTRVPPEAIERGQRLQMIVRRGQGVSNIAVEEASAQGVFVAHCPTEEAVAIAELTFGLALALDRDLVTNAVAMRERALRERVVRSQGLATRTLGVLNFGPVGRELARRAKAFGMDVLGWAPALDHDEKPVEGVEFVSWPRELARRSDVIAVHAPPEGMDELLVDAEFVSNMRDRASFIHIGRPGAIDHEALAVGVEKKGLRVAVDLMATDPSREMARYKWRLFDLPGVIGTPGLGPLTIQAREATAAEAVRIIRRFLVYGEPSHCVNLAERSPATWQLVLRLRDTAGVMAAIMDAIRADDINAEEITCRVFTGAQAAWCVIALDERPSAHCLEAIGAADGVLHLDLRAVV